MARPVSLFDWKYCECGCHSSGFSVGNLHFAKLGRPEGYLSPVSPPHIELSEHGCGGFLYRNNKRFGTQVQMDEYILRKLHHAQLELRRAIDKARGRQTKK